MPLSSTAQPSALRLLGGFELHVDGQRRRLTHSARRLVGLLGVHDAPLPRRFVAFTLWLEKREDRALANLRSMVWRLGSELDGIICADSSEVGLSPDIRVDFREAKRAALDVLEGRSGLIPRTHIDVLLPGWYEEWVVVEREHLRLLHLHALEKQAQGCLDRGEFGDAFTAAMAATSIDPLRESALQLLIRASTARGNTADAIRIYDRYRISLQTELGLDPSPALADLVWSGQHLDTVMPMRSASAHAQSAQRRPALADAPEQR